MQINVNLEASAADLITQFGAGAKLFLYSSSTAAGTYALVSGAAQVLVAGTERYELQDAAGVPGTTWYKPVVGDTTGAILAGGPNITDTTDATYIAPFRSGSIAAYATIDDLAETMSLPDESRYNLLSDLLADASAAVDVATGRQFYRSPQVSGTETFYVDVLTSGTTSLAIASDYRGCSDGKALDIVSVTTLEVRDSETSSYTTLTVDSDFFLMQGRGPGVSGIDWPFEDIERVSYTWPTGLRAVRIVGVRGFPKVPSAVKSAVISETRNRYRMGVGTGGGAAEGDDTEWLRVMFQPYKKSRPTVA